MKIFLDSANIDEIRKANDWGVIDGVTTNPTLVAKENRGFDDVVREILARIYGPVSLEVIRTDCEGMVEEALKLTELSENVVIKIPMTPDGLKAVKILSAKNIRTNVTLVFSVNQGLLAAKAGASYVSPFIGRLDDIGDEGMDVVRDLIQVFRQYGFKTEIIVASVRHPLHVIEAAKAGAHVTTIPFSVIEKMFSHPLTDAGLAKFLNDWKKVPK
ncbi:MAG: fructose-6-phosphate aldolase [Methanoregulaceae archaeon]